MQQKISDKYRRVPANGYVIAAVVISSLLHASAAAWWLSRQAQMVEIPGLQEVTVSLISPEPPAPEPVAVPPPPAPPEPELLRDDEMAEKHKVIKKKPPEKKPQPQPLQEQPKIPVPVAESKPAPAPVTAARYDADYLNNPKPSYPEQSRRLGEEGKALIKVQVSADGKVLSVELKQSSGFERLDQAALKAVAKYRFTAIGHSSSVVVPMDFVLPPIVKNKRGF